MTIPVEKFYTDFHQRRDKSERPGMSWRLPFLQQNMLAGMVALELGCRYGSIMEHLSGDKGDTVVLGTDIDRRALRRARGKGLSVFAADLNYWLPVQDSAVDVVLLTEVLEHLPYVEAVVNEVARILKPDGRLIGTVPNGTRLKNRLAFAVTGEIPEDTSHLQLFSRRGLEELLSSSFREVRVVCLGGRFSALGQAFTKSLCFVAERPVR